MPETKLLVVVGFVEGEGGLVGLEALWYIKKV